MDVVTAEECPGRKPHVVGIRTLLKLKGADCVLSETLRAFTIRSEGSGTVCTAVKH